MSQLLHGSADLTSRLDFETLISDLSARLVTAPDEAFETVIEEALGRVIRFFGADRGGILVVSQDRRSLHLIHAWYAETLKERVPQDINLAEHFPYAYHLVVERRQPFIVHSYDDVPADAAVDRASHTAMGVRSTLNIPIAVGADLRYVMNIDAMRQEIRWPPSYVPRLQLLGEIFANAVERKTAEEALATAHAEVLRLREQLERENTYLRQEVTSRKARSRIVGGCQSIRLMMEEVAKVAPTNATVLLLGETGTGKELVANAIHGLSPRHDRVMVRVNCAAIPVTLIESELFGRERGAYTGALSKQVGRFELASGSTVFLDEIGDLPLDIQAKLLRVLQERQIERLGSPRPVPVDLRIIAATNRDLDRDVRDGRFREDLFYRLNVFPVRVPPLRDRLEDIPLLVAALVDELAGPMGKRIDRVSRASLDALARYAWPGNVRELRNAVERALILAAGPVLEIVIPGANGPGPDGSPAPGAGTDRLDREEYLRVLKQTGWRIRGKRGAAGILGLKPTTLETRMARLGIKRP